jgi:signal transduction histidine kinase
MIRLTIRDNGPGIASGQLENIFEPFIQSHDDPGAPARGFGLGLAICRRITEANQGQIWAESAAGQGAILVMTLPVAKD